jgi:hypothetical protein
MKTLLLLGSAAWLCACGSSSNGTPPTDLQPPPMPISANQTYQKPTDSVPPVNSQSPPANAQQPPLAGSATTCDQVAAALARSGCVVSETEMAKCIASVTAAAPCSAQYQALLVCMVKGVVCGSDGTPDVSRSCPHENDALTACMANSVTQGGCTAAGGCLNCADLCATCRCGATLDSSLNCTPICTVAN